ncbi:hypothetical protein CRYUN_Cryun38cG0054900 [Craigia yunnanensis]
MGIPTSTSKLSLKLKLDSFSSRTHKATRKLPWNFGFGEVKINYLRALKFYLL